jgi:glycerol-3-phosphate dehydrogenase
MTTAPRQNLDGKRFDVVILGGGINGAAIARECVRAHKTVLLVEQNDFASGTTSRATRIIHGGLRYLEYGELGLVRESLREREMLLAEDGHLVRPLNFLLALPHDSRRSALAVRFGLWLYRRIARRKPIHDAKDDRRRLEQLLDHGQQWSVFSYEDAQCEYPERLIAGWLVETATFGSVFRNYTEALEVERNHGLVTGVRLRDRVTAEEYTAKSDWIINATGPWADAICRRSNIETDDPLIGGVRGAHILLPMINTAPKAAIYTEALDGRPVFVIPWAGQLLVGTTEVRDNRDPSQVTASKEEVAYLLKCFQRLFPSTGFGFHDIRAAFAGIRPLPHITERTPNSVTRRHFLVDHADDGAQNMISVIGGKLTTAASLARECARAMGINVPEPKGYAAITDFDNTALHQLDRELGGFARIPFSSVKAITRLFGAAGPRVFKVIQQNDSFRKPICPHTHHLVGEAVYAARNEFAVTLADILLRRVPVALGPCWSEECTRIAAQNIGTALHWTPERIAIQADDFQEEYDRFLRKPSAADSQ